MRPLDGITVLDATRLLPGAAATMMLVNFGAEVIKIEEPGAGDYARTMPPLIEGEGAVFRAVNRGKKSLAIDLKSPQGRQDFRKLASSADVLIEGFRPGVMQRLGFDYETLRTANERLIYVSLTGYGQSGPYASLAGHDINYLSLGGLLDLNGAKDEPPAIPAVQIADLAGGSMQAVIGVLLALAAREKTGRGQFVDAGMMDGVAWLLAVPLALREAGIIPHRGDTTFSGRYACYRTYQTADGRWLAVGALEPKFWSTLCENLDCPDLIPLQFVEGDEQIRVIKRLSEIFRSKEAGEWVELLGRSDCCVTLVQNLEEVIDDAHLRERGTIVNGRLGVIPKLSDTPGHVGGDAPALVESNRRK